MAGLAVDGGFRDLPFELPQGADDDGVALNLEIDAVAGVADPAQSQIARVVVGFDREHRLTFDTDAMVFDSVEQHLDLLFAKTGVDVLADGFEKEGEVFGLGLDADARGRLVGVFELADDFRRCCFSEALEASGVVPAHDEDSGDRQQPGSNDGSDEEAGQMVRHQGHDLTGYTGSAE